MKNRLGNPEFLVRLDIEQEKKLIPLAKDFQQNSYAKTLVSIAMTYESEKRIHLSTNAALRKQVAELTKKLNEEKKFNKLITSKLGVFQKLVNKVADIKKPLLQLARTAGSRLK